MNKKRIVVIVVAISFAGVGSVQAQRSGAGRPGGSGQGQMAGQQQQSSGQQQSMRSQQQMQVQSQATGQQRAAMKQTIAATQQMRSQLRPMMRLEKGQQIGADQAKRWREQIREQLQTMQQEQQALIAGLTEEQQSWADDDIQQVKEATASLDDLLDSLSLELEQAKIDEQAVKQTAKKADDKAKKVESEQKQILTELNLGN
jgi:hypothetical protein